MNQDVLKSYEATQVQLDNEQFQIILETMTYVKPYV